MLDAEFKRKSRTGRDSYISGKYVECIKNNAFSVLFFRGGHLQIQLS